MTQSKHLGRFLALTLILVLALAVGFWIRPVSFYREYSALRLRLAGAASRTTFVAGYRIHYYAMGPADGPVVVLVHGLGGCAEDWQRLAPFLTRAGYRVYLPDLPGFGQSEQPANFSYSIPDQARIVAGFLDAVGLKQIDLGGWSMGGWIVQHVAYSHPERVRRLMLFDSAGIYEAPKWDTQLFTPATPHDLEQLDPLLMPDPPRVPGFVARDILRTSRRNAWVIHKAVNSMLLGRDTTDSLLPVLKMPVLLVWGSEDHITPLHQGEKMHQLIPQSRLDVIEGCGHLAPDQCGAQVGPKVVEFLAQ